MSKFEYRTYMSGYDLGDWLTIKSDTNLYTAIQITKITTTSDIHDFYNNKYASNDLYIKYKHLVVKTRPTIDYGAFKGIVRGFMWESNTISYTDLLKEYRPLTDSEKLLYITEDVQKPQKPFSW